MNMDIIPTGPQPLTMSSREIAELCEKNHAHVLRDIRKMLIDIFGGDDLDRIVPEQYRNRHSEYIRENADEIMGKLFGDDPNLVYPNRGFKWSRDTRGYVSEFWMNKDLTVTLITGYRADLRYKVVKRLEELEAAAPKPAILSGPQLLAAALIEADATMKEQAAQIQVMRADVAAHERLTKADGSLSVTDAAKNLGIRPKELFDYLSHNGWIYKRPNTTTWLGYQSRCNQGLMEHKTTLVLRADGSEKITEQVRITAKGLSILAKKIPRPYWPENA